MEVLYQPCRARHAAENQPRTGPHTDRLQRLKRRRGFSQSNGVSLRRMNYAVAFTELTLRWISTRHFDVQNCSINCTLYNLNTPVTMLVYGQVTDATCGPPEYLRQIPQRRDKDMSVEMYLTMQNGPVVILT